jgi:hypothetical protein
MTQNINANRIKNITNPIQAGIRPKTANNRIKRTIAKTNLKASDGFFSSGL